MKPLPIPPQATWSNQEASVSDVQQGHPTCSARLLEKQGCWMRSKWAGDTVHHLPSLCAGTGLGLSASHVGGHQQLLMFLFSQRPSCSSKPQVGHGSPCLQASTQEPEAGGLPQGQHQSGLAEIKPNQTEQQTSGGSYGTTTLCRKVCLSSRYSARKFPSTRMRC